MPLTSSIPQDDLALASDPAVAGELNIIPVGCLQCDILQVPVVMQPVLALLDFDQVDVAQFFIYCHIVRINLRRRKGKLDCVRSPEPCITLNSLSQGICWTPASGKALCCTLRHSFQVSCASAAHADRWE